MDLINHVFSVPPDECGNMMRDSPRGWKGTDQMRAKSPQRHNEKSGFNLPLQPPKGERLIRICNGSCCGHPIPFLAFGPFGKLYDICTVAMEYFEPMCRCTPIEHGWLNNPLILISRGWHWEGVLKVLWCHCQVKGSEILFSDGSRSHFDHLLIATGYRVSSEIWEWQFVV